MSNKKQERLETCSLRLRSGLLAELREISERTDRSLANTMRRIIESSFADYKKAEGIELDRMRIPKIHSEVEKTGRLPRRNDSETDQLFNLSWTEVWFLGGLPMA